MKRPDPLMPAKPGAEDAEAMTNRVLWLDALYLHDGRDKRNHPNHGLYTGLWKQYSYLGEVG